MMQLSMPGDAFVVERAERPGKKLMRTPNAARSTAV